MSTENTLDTAPASDLGAESAKMDAGKETGSQTSTPAAASGAQAGIDKSIGEKLADIKAGKDATAASTGQTPVTAGANGVYTPNYKYRAAMQDKELDAFWRPLVKDADSEKKVKELFTKVEAFDYLKNKTESVEGNFKSLKEDYDSQNTIVQKIVGSIKNNDLDSAFRNIGLSDDQIIRWAAKKVDYLQMMNQLPPDQRAAIEQQQHAVVQNQDYQDQLNQMQSQFEVQATQARELQMEMVLSRTEVNQAASFWDQKMGQTGAFRDLVIEEGQKAWFTQGVDLNAEQATARVMQRFGKFIDLQGHAPQTQVQPQNQTVATPGQVAAAKPVIPAINGTSKTPIKKQFQSLDEIKKYNKERQQLEA